MTEAGIQYPNGLIDPVEARRIADLGLSNHLDMHHWIGRSTGIVGPHQRIDIRGSDFNGQADARLVTELYSQYPNIKSWRVRNEPNLESPGRTPDDWYKYLSDLAENVPDSIRLFAAAVSPGTGDWLNWFRATVKAKHGFSGIDAHIYGDPKEFETTLKQIRDIYDDLLYVTEYNFGAGRPYDLQKYADDWPRILQLCTQYKVDICFVFIWRWVNPDMTLPTTVNVINTPMEAAMKSTKFKVALVPSNQDKNPVLGGGNEMEQVTPFMEVLYSQAPSFVEAKIFTPKPESLDAYKYEGLYTVQKSVEQWKPDLAFNIHTDSGYYSHTGTYNDGSELMKKFGDILCPLLRQYIKGPCARGNYSDYVFATVTAPAILLELGSHQVKEDILALKNNAAGIAQAIWKGVEMLFGDTVANPSEIKKHLDLLWAGANQMKATEAELRATAKNLISRADLLARDSAASYERIIALKKELGIQ